MPAAFRFDPCRIARLDGSDVVLTVSEERLRSAGFVDGVVRILEDGTQSAWASWHKTAKIIPKIARLDVQKLDMGKLEVNGRPTKLI